MVIFKIYPNHGFVHICSTGFGNRSKRFMPNSDAVAGYIKLMFVSVKCPNFLWRCGHVIVSKMTSRGTVQIVHSRTICNNHAEVFKVHTECHSIM